jgi:hypothetical protein
MLRFLGRLLGLIAPLGQKQAMRRCALMKQNGVRALQRVLSHCLSVSKHPVSLSHCLIASMSQCLSVSLSHCLIVSLSHCLIVSLSHAQMRIALKRGQQPKDPSGHRGNLGWLEHGREETLGSPGNPGNPAPIQVTLIFVASIRVNIRLLQARAAFVPFVLHALNSFSCLTHQSVRHCTCKKSATTVRVLLECSQST